MPSCKCILDRMVHKGAMTKDERDKIVRNLKPQNEGFWVQTNVYSIFKCPFCGERSVLQSNYCPNCGAKLDVEDCRVKLDVEY